MAQLSKQPLIVSSPLPLPLPPRGAGGGAGGDGTRGRAVPCRRARRPASAAPAAALAGAAPPPAPRRAAPSLTAVRAAQVCLDVAAQARYVRVDETRLHRGRLLRLPFAWDAAAGAFYHR